jgi:Helicase conserved C-terminal domain
MRRLVPAPKQIMTAGWRINVVRVSGNGRRAGDDGFGEWLRRRTDEELAALLAARMDLLTPAPAGIDALATRASRRLSLDRALDDLDQFTLHVIDVLVELPAPVPVDRLREALGTGAGPLRGCLATLSARALVWRAGGGLRPAPGLRAVITEPPLAAGRGRVPPEPPPLDGIQNGSRDVDQAAAGAALDALRSTEELLTLWAAQPPPVLRSCGLGIRELRKAATFLDIDIGAAAFYTEVARAAGLLAASSWTNGEWLPSRAFDTWLRAAPADRWATLVSAWLATTRVPALIGGRDDRGRMLNALGTGLDRMDAPRVRALVLRELATAGPGLSVTTSSMLRRLAWLWPRRLHGAQAMLAEAAASEAALLGLTGLYALAANGRAVVSAGPQAAAAVLAPILPEPVGHVLVQADLTAVAPGPLTTELAHELSLAADVESRGGATVYRFSAGSVRRALDAGRTGADLLALLEKHSTTAVPQPLRYLIEDVARHHGQIRVGTASAYIRCDDPAVLAEIAADRRAAARLGLRKLAPTVLTSSSCRSDVLSLLRQMGYAPAAETADGTIEVTATVSRRAEDGHRAPAVARSDALAEVSRWTAGERVLAAVRVLRGGDEAAGATAS